MNYFEAIWKSIVLGTVQGITEFLPVSSSGHLSLLQRVLGFNMAGGSMMFVNVMLHLGTLAAVVFVFWRDILGLFKKPFKTLLMLVVATVPAAVVGVLAADKIDAIFAGAQGLLYLAVCFACTAAMLLACEIVSKRWKAPKPLGWKNALPMGLMQAVALFPGISRSGSTIVAGAVTGAKREEVAKFSFLMSIPIILGSVVMEVKDLIFPGEEGIALSFGGPEAVGMVFGVVCAAIFGFFSVKVMLKVIGKANYKWFAFYLVLLSMTCFWLDALAVL